MKRITGKPDTINGIACSLQKKCFTELKKTCICVLFSVLLLSMTGSLSFGQHVKSDSANSSIILFVCEHSVARSTTAAASLNKLAKEKGLNYKAIFRGINPDSSISNETKKGLTEDGFNVTEWQPSLVSKNDLNTATEIIALDCTLSENDSLAKPIYYWNGIPAINKDYQAARNYILHKITILIEELEKKKKFK
jgi:arsenate reductase (thioredoxin)